MRRLAFCALVLFLALAPVAEARHVPYLSYGEAMRAIGRELHEAYYVERGSLAGDCRRLARNRVRCYISFAFQDGDYGCGPATVRENRAYYSIRWSLDYC